MRIHLTLSKTRDGGRQYLQVMSEDQISMNIVLVADEFLLQDMRNPGRPLGWVARPSVPQKHVIKKRKASARPSRSGHSRRR